MLKYYYGVVFLIINNLCIKGVKFTEQYVKKLIVYIYIIYTGNQH